MDAVSCHIVLTRHVVAQDTFVKITRDDSLATGLEPYEARRLFQSIDTECAGTQISQAL